MDNKEYGVKLKLILSDFQSGIGKATNMAKQFVNKTKSDFTTGLYMDTAEAQSNLTSLEDKLKEARQSLNDLENKKLSGFTIPTSQIDEAKNSIASLRQQISDTKNDLQTIKTSPFAKLGQSISSVKSKISSIDLSKLSLGFQKASESGKKLKNSVSNVASKLKQLLSSSKNIGNSLSGPFDKGIKSLKKFTLSLFGIQSAYRAVSKAASAYLSYDTKLNDTIQSTWAGLGSFLAPALEYIASLFQKLLGYINAFVKTLTGIDFVARANSKALQNQATSTKKASNALASFDELQNINQPSDGGGDVGQISVPEVDTSGIEKAFEKIKGILEKLFEPIQASWNKYGASVIKSAKAMFSSLGNAIKSIGKSWMEVWTNGTGEAYINSILILVRQIFSIVSQIANAFTEAWNNAGLGTSVIQGLYDASININNLFSTILDSFSSVITNGTLVETFTLIFEIINNITGIVGGLAGAFQIAWMNAGSGTTIIQTIADNFNNILKFVNSISGSLKKWVLSEGFQEALSGVIDMISDIMQLGNQIGTWLLEMYEKYVKPTLEDKVLPAISDVITAITDVWKAIKPVVDNAVKIIETVLEPVIKGLMDFIGGIVTVIRGIAQFISGVFTGDWKKAWTGIKNIFKGIWDALSSIIKTPINTVIAGVEFLVNKLIDGFNSVKKMLNKLSFDIPDWIPIIGGKKWGFNLKESSHVKIPRLNIGTDNVLSEGMAYLHAGEKVVPADVVKGGYSGEGNNNEETNNLLRQLIDLVSEKDYNPTITVEDVGKASVNYIRKQRRVTGGSVI